MPGSTYFVNDDVWCLVRAVNSVNIYFYLFFVNILKKSKEEERDYFQNASIKLRFNI